MTNSVNKKHPGIVKNAESQENNEKNTSHNKKFERDDKAIMVPLAQRFAIIAHANDLDTPQIKKKLLDYSEKENPAASKVTKSAIHKWFNETTRDRFLNTTANAFVDRFFEDMPNVKYPAGLINAGLLKILKFYELKYNAIKNLLDDDTVTFVNTLLQESNTQDNIPYLDLNTSAKMIEGSYFRTFYLYRMDSTKPALRRETIKIIQKDKRIVCYLRRTDPSPFVGDVRFSRRLIHLFLYNKTDNPDGQKNYGTKEHDLSTKYMIFRMNEVEGAPLIGVGAGTAESIDTPTAYRLLAKRIPEEDVKNATPAVVALESYDKNDDTEKNREEIKKIICLFSCVNNDDPVSGLIDYALINLDQYMLERYGIGEQVYRAYMADSDANFLNFREIWVKYIKQIQAGR